MKTIYDPPESEDNKPPAPGVLAWAIGAVAVAVIAAAVLWGG